MIQQEILNKYEKEISDLINKLEEKNRKDKRIKELTLNLKAILQELDSLHAYVYIICNDCGKYIDISSQYQDITVEQ